MNSERPNGQHDGNHVISVGVVCGHDDFQKAMAIRAAVYVGEQGRPYGHEFDGNDHHASHVLATVNGEPAGTCRIRYFGDFAKVERLAVLPRFRNQRFGARGVAYAAAKHAFDFCARKGIRQIYGHSLKGPLVKFWGRLGLKPMENGEFDIPGYRCVAVLGTQSLPEDALSLHSGHLVLVRREGAWDDAGVLDIAPDALGTTAGEPAPLDLVA